MKNFLITCFLALLITPMMAQDEESGGESASTSIADIMNVTPVAVVMSEDVEKENTEYGEDFDDEKKKLDEAIAKVGEGYKKDVGEVIGKFSKVLEKAIEQDVSNEKRTVASKVNSLTFAVRKDKKQLVTTFNNKMSAKIRKMHKSLQKDRFKELAEVNEEKLEAFDEEFEANQGVIKQFKSTEHLTAAAEGGGDASGN